MSTEVILSRRLMHTLRAGLASHGAASMTVPTDTLLMVHRLANEQWHAEVRERSLRWC